MDLDDAELIDRAHKAANGGKFSRLWAGDWEGAGYPSQSEADLALAEILAFWTGGDPERIDRLFRQSGLYRDKWARPDYRDRTIARALSMTTEFYNQEKPQDGNGQTHEKEKTSASGPGQAPRPDSQAPTPSSVPAWPEGAIGGVAGRFAKIFAQYLETPAQFMVMSFLTILGHIIGDRIALRSELKPPPRLYTALLGKPGDTRKSTAINAVGGFFRESINSDDLNIVYGVGSAEGLAKCFKRNQNMLLAIDELKTLVQKMKIDTSVLLPCINTLFEINRFHSHTKKHDIELEDASLSLLAASTIETYQTMFNSTFTDIGFINRLFIVIGGSERKFAVPQVIPETEKKPLKQELGNILHLVGELARNGQYLMPMASEAVDIFEKWYFERPDSVFTTRLDTYGHRLMPLLAVNEMLDIITPEIAEKTVSLLEYQYAARQYADPIDADTTIAKIEERVRRLLASGPLEKRELERRGNKNRVGIWTWDQAIKNLRTAGEIIWDPKAKKFLLTPTTK